METTEIVNHTELLMRITLLREEKCRQEEEIKDTFNNFVSTLDPVYLVKKSLHNLAEDKDVQYNLSKVVLNFGTSFIIDKILGKNRSIKGFLSAVLVERFSTSVINNNLPKIISVITNLLHKNSEKKEADTYSE